MAATGTDRPPRGRGGRWGWRGAAAAAVLAGFAALWIWWSEDHPREERRLRVLVHDRLDQWFPRDMSPDDGWHGLHARGAAPAGSDRLPTVVLLHGLDEPGTIWDDLAPELAAAGYAIWELRYPNDQGIDRSAAYLAGLWSRLPDAVPAVTIGHSMGGLVAREFVSRWRHPVGAPPRAAGPPVGGVILVGTPNQGSEWARLRVWMELRDHFYSASGRRFSLFAALRDGTGEAKIDLRPGSDFLNSLNARPWPQEVPVLAIAGRLLSPPEGLAAGLDAASRETGSPQLRRRLAHWWGGIGEGLGDGVVTMDSVRVPGGPPPLVVDAAHRGMILRLLPGDPQPPAIDPIMATLRAWAGRSAGDPPPHPPGPAAPRGVEPGAAPGVAPGSAR